MMVTASARLLVGRKIVAVEMTPTDDGKGGTAHLPRIRLDNGALLTFTTEETEHGWYGTSIDYHPAKRKVSK